MSNLRLATAANVRAFHSLAHALDTSDGKWSDSIDREALEDEAGRFRVWSGNLGALQKGHSSLDYRLRDSPLLSSNALKFLQELEDNLSQAYAIVTGARLPYEQQPELKENVKNDGSDDDGFFSDDESEGEEGPSRPRTELSMRFVEVVDIIDNLYKLSVRIRTPTIRIRSLKAASYQPKDSDTGVDLLAAYAIYDLSHIKELLSSLRQPFSSNEQSEEDFLFARLGAAITLRRRQFKYWKRHRDKLASATVVEERALPPQTTIDLSGPLPQDLTPNINYDLPAVNASKDTPSQKTGRTLLSGTEATYHHQSLDDIVDTKSVTSYAITVKDIHGRGVDLPPPPKEAIGDKDFECPYCYIICPARYGHGRAWRTHILQDLQPYCCTYAECDRAEQLFRSRREWVEHEASHRKVWRCPEHPNAVYKSPAGLENHLRQEHLDSFPESQLPTIVKVGETTTVDIRTHCPICFASADTNVIGDFQSHVANHLERVATFALPSGIDDDSDGASGIASHGGSGSTDSHRTTDSTKSSADTIQGNSKTTDTANVGDAEIDLSLHPDLGLGSSRTLLSADSLQQLPDSSQDRLDMITVQLEQAGELDEMRTGDGQTDDSPLDLNSEDGIQLDESPADIQEHLELREAFRVHLLSLPGASSVRFYKRYGSWTGRVDFSNGVSAAEALTLFDKDRFPNIRLFQSAENPSKLKFHSSTHADGNKPPTRKSTATAQDQFDPLEGSPGPVEYETEEQRSKKQPVLTVAGIPTLRSLYRSRQLLPRDQSYAPNDKYNQLISLCYYDLTRLKVDAIVNSSNNALSPTRAAATLNNAVHRAAGSGLWEETKSKAKLKSGQTELSHGHNLPSSWIIHAARPQFGRNKGMGQFNVLTECYRSALRMANNYEFKTIAFPSLGAGGCGFPPRIAARLALQEVREYLDAHPDCLVERIVFCVNTAIDEKAYIDFLPVFFPPTHGDLERARLSDFSAYRVTLAAQILETREQVQKVNEKLLNDFGLLVPDFDDRILKGLSAIDSSLASIRGVLLGPQEINRSLGDLNLICSTMQMICSCHLETIELARDNKDTLQNNQKSWGGYNAYMRNIHSTDFLHILKICQTFVQNLDKIVTSGATEPEEMAEMRSRLETFAVKQKGEDSKGIRDHLDEALYAREFQQEEDLQSRNTVKLYQIPSLARLYQDGGLDATSTLAHSLNFHQEGALSSRSTLSRPSAIFNQTVCLIREDITLLEVDIMVNSTDMSFMGMGTLDRLIFKKGGPELRDKVKQFGECNQGDVKLTPGYMLPAKHLLHAIPPEQYNKETKNILRGIYREVLFTATSLSATSVALPCIGTGMLNYSIRDCASLAIEEVKRFLESAEPTNSIEKIIFVTFSSSNERIYKSLLPVYFPPVENEEESSTKQPRDGDGLSTMTDTREKPRRTLFRSVGEALRGVRSGKQTEISRNINNYEENALFGFESHATTCPTCKDLNKLYSEGRSLCAAGNSEAQLLLGYMEMTENQTIHTKRDKNGQSVKLIIPERIYPTSLKLLHTVEKATRDKSRHTPFLVVPTQSKTQDPSRTSPPPLPSTHDLEAHRVAAWSPSAQKWESIYTGPCIIHITPYHITPYHATIFRSDEPPDQRQPLLSLPLPPAASIHYHETNTQLLLSGLTNATSYLDHPASSPLLLDRILFLTPSPQHAQDLLRYLAPFAQHVPAAPEMQAEALIRPPSVNPLTASAAAAAAAKHRSPFSRMQSRIKSLVASSASGASMAGAEPPAQPPPQE